VGWGEGGRESFSRCLGIYTKILTHPVSAYILLSYLVPDPICHVRCHQAHAFLEGGDLRLSSVSLRDSGRARIMRHIRRGRMLLRHKLLWHILLWHTRLIVGGRRRDVADDWERRRRAEPAAGAGPAPGFRGQRALRGKQTLRYFTGRPFQGGSCYLPSLSSTTSAGSGARYRLMSTGPSAPASPPCPPTNTLRELAHEARTNNAGRDPPSCSFALLREREMFGDRRRGRQPTCRRLNH